ncbi:MAG: hypothetical protein LDL16_09660 [Thiobacillus sp.]|nr:hypothetical protein [Thiobacillus sp.]
MKWLPDKGKWRAGVRLVDFFPRFVLRVAAHHEPRAVGAPDAHQPQFARTVFFVLQHAIKGVGHPGFEWQGVIPVGAGLDFKTRIAFADEKPVFAEVFGDAPPVRISAASGALTACASGTTGSALA